MQRACKGYRFDKLHRHTKRIGDLIGIKPYPGDMGTGVRIPIFRGGCQLQAVAFFVLRHCLQNIVI
jgi:hypothetical protein